MSTLHDQIISNRLFDKIHPDWNQIILKCISDLHKSLIQVATLEEIAPPAPDIFNALILSPKDVKVVIIGQDPYSKLGDANGFSFSSNAENTPAILKNIFTCLNRLGYETKSPNLFNWATQGVLLLNMSLTTKINCKRSHCEYWHTFVCSLISEFSGSSREKVHFLLWGNDAQKLESHIKGKHIIHKWTHPSPMADCQLVDSKKFINCDNFDKIKHIDWSTGNIFNLYTDGGCELHKKASFAIYWEEILEISGLIKDHLYELDNGIIKTKKDTNIQSTSQRGEYLALCYALWIIDYLNIKNVKVITDSHNAYGILCEYHKRKEEKYINSDLVHIMRLLYEKIKEKNKVEIIHIKSHRKTESIYNDGNELADSLATKSLKYENKKINIKYLKAEFYLPL